MGGGIDRRPYPAVWSFVACACRAAEREGNFVSTSTLGLFSCPTAGDAFVQPFDLSWTLLSAGRNLNCSVFSRKWSVAASTPLFELLQEMGVLPKEAEA